MSTISTNALYSQLRTYLLAYQNKDGHSLGAALVNRLYQESAPLRPTYPYATFGLRTPQLDAGNQQLKQTYEFEGFIYHRPASTRTIAKSLGDLWAEALRVYRDGSSGLVYFTDVRAEALPPAPSPADANIATVRVVGRCRTWPTFINDLSS